jgi:hypothetical protein
VLAHWPSTVQEVKHAVAPQTYGEQFVVPPLLQLPVPSQAEASVATPSEQLALPQEVELSG